MHILSAFFNLNSFAPVFFVVKSSSANSNLSSMTSSEIPDWFETLELKILTLSSSMASNSTIVYFRVEISFKRMRL